MAANNYFGFTHGGTQYRAQSMVLSPQATATYPAAAAAPTAYVQPAQVAAYATAATPQATLPQSYEAYPAAAAPGQQYAYTAPRQVTPAYDATKAYYTPTAAAGQAQNVYTMAESGYQTSQPKQTYQQTKPTSYAGGQNKPTYGATQPKSTYTASQAKSTYSANQSKPSYTAVHLKQTYSASQQKQTYSETQNKQTYGGASYSASTQVRQNVTKTVTPTQSSSSSYGPSSTFSHKNATPAASSAAPAATATRAAATSVEAPTNATGENMTSSTYIQAPALKSNSAWAYKRPGMSVPTADGKGVLKMKIVANQPLFCELCKISCGGREQYQNHLDGKKHKRAEMLKATMTDSSSKPNPGPGMVLCEVCDVSCSGKEAYATHIRGVKHKKVVNLHTLLGKPVPLANLDNIPDPPKKTLKKKKVPTATLR